MARVAREEEARNQGSAKSSPDLNWEIAGHPEQEAEPAADLIHSREAEQSNACTQLPALSQAGADVLHSFQMRFGMSDLHDRALEAVDEVAEQARAAQFRERTVAVRQFLAGCRSAR